jgi:hypothetical protein
MKPPTPWLAAMEAAEQAQDLRVRGVRSTKGCAAPPPHHPGWSIGAPILALQRLPPGALDGLQPTNHALRVWNCRMPVL